MSNYLDDLAKLTRSKQDIVSESIYIVDGVREDGLINLRVGKDRDAILNGLPALNSYVNRKKGDRVVVRKSQGLWVVVGKAGVEDSKASVSSGVDAPPGNGWTKATAVYVRGNEVYIQSGDSSGGGGAGNPVGRVVISPNSYMAYADGYANPGRTPRQGTYSGYGPEYSGWFYGNKIPNACSGRTVSSMSIRLVRSGSRHGYYTAQRPSIWDHIYGSPPSNLGLHDRQDPSHGLGLGEGYDYPLTDVQVANLSSGTTLGIGVYTTEYRTDYIIFTGSCGQITITFSD